MTQVIPTTSSNNMMMNNMHHQQQVHQSASSKAASVALPYATTTLQAIDRYGFVPVFPTTEAIQAPSAEVLAKHNMTKPSKGQVPWRCIECDTHTFGHKCTCCNRPRETGALRVFVGKLCREGAAEMTASLLSLLCPNLSGPVLHIEAHTHASNGRGKGCSWIYVRTAEDVKVIVEALHRRTFVSVHPQTGEVGFIPFPAKIDDAEVEAVFNNDHDNRPRFIHYLLHRGQLTAEIPESMQSDINNKLMNNKTSPQQDFVPSATTLMMKKFHNIPTPAYNQQQQRLVPQGFQQQIPSYVQPPPPAVPQYNNQEQQAPTPAAQEPPRPVLATTSWFQEEEDENIISTEETSNNEEATSSSSTGTPTPTKSSCKVVIHNGKRYMWNPY